ncbi:MAG: hypothetical protein ACTS4Z_00075 [Candidatus Hodgkinia cicadicola]
MKLLIKLVAKLCQTNEMLKRENLTLATGIRILRNVSDINIHQLSSLRIFRSKVQLNL